MAPASTQNQNADGTANDDGGGVLQENARDAERARKEARENWDQAASRRDGKESKEGESPGLDRGASTAPDARGDVPPGIDAQDLFDPGSRQPDSPPVKNKS